MKKSIITIVAFMLFALAGFAQGGDLVSVRVLYTGTKTAKLLVYEKGIVTQTDIPSACQDEMKPVLEMLEKYTKQGYKLLTSTLFMGVGAHKEYILQKD